MKNLLYRRGRRAQAGNTGNRGRNTHRGFTLIEVLVSVLLLSLSLAAMVTLWSVSRKITERSRDWSEFYAVARREAEDTRAAGFSTVFFNNAYVVGTNNVTAVGVKPVTATQYNKDAATPDATNPAVYEAVSTFYRKPTGTEDPQRQLGVQVIDVYLMPHNAADLPVYSTTAFLSIEGG